MGISSGIGHYLIGIQSAKGAVATTFRKYRAAGDANFSPIKEVARYSMTDAGRDRGDAYVSGIRVEGDLPVYLHFDGAALLAYGAMGANADSGAVNFTHTITPADDLPWLTVFRMVGNVIEERYIDCKINTFRLESSAGGTPIVTLGLLGLVPSWLTLPASTAVVGDPYKHYEAKDLIKIATVAQRIHTLTFEVVNNINWYQADDFLGSDLDIGGREINFSFGLHFTGPTAEPKYREFLYGGDAGVAAVAAIQEKAIEFEFVRNVNTGFKVAMPEVAYAAVPVNASPGADPLDVEVACEVNKPTAGAITTITVRDQNATPGA
jgi:hypothetical protein